MRGPHHHWCNAIKAFWPHLAWGACSAESRGVSLEGLALTKAQRFPNLVRRNRPKLGLARFEVCPKFERKPLHRDLPSFFWELPSNFRATGLGPWQDRKRAFGGGFC